MSSVSSVAALCCRSLRLPARLFDRDGTAKGDAFLDGGAAGGGEFDDEVVLAAGLYSEVDGRVVHRFNAPVSRSNLLNDKHYDILDTRIFQKSDRRRRRNVNG